MQTDPSPPPDHRSHRRTGTGGEPTRIDAPHGRILVLGASGYVGGRLVPDLVGRGHRVRCLTRSVESLRTVPWAGDVEIAEGDVFDPSTLNAAFDGVDTAVYLVHSLDEEDFERNERRAAEHVCDAAAAAGVRHIVYLGGLGRDDDDLSPHLRSRHAVGRALADGPAAVTELRAAVLIGAGSASFEMLRSLTEVLPAMLAPQWVTRTRVQPIAVGDALHFLLAAIEQGPEDHHRIVEIGGPDQLTYRELINLYADVAGLRRRLVVPIALVTPRLSTHWVNLVTPLPRRLAAALIDSLRNDVVVTDPRPAQQLSDHRPLSARDAIVAALSAVQDLDIPTRWSGFTSEQHAGRPQPWDADWSGGTVYQYVTTATTTASAAQVQRTVRGIGGDRGWYGFGPLWAIRGAIDQLVGGVGLRRGRRHPDEIFVGEALDFWRADRIEPDLFRLRAEMKLPGDGWLEWSTTGTDGGTSVDQRARFVPRGIGGRLYWWPLWPVHALLFPLMLRRIVRAAELRKVDEPVEG
jgi:uncharacterized protein YbjT (DUF2867 family)